MQIPADWSPIAASLEDFRAVSHQGETFHAAVTQIPMTEQAAEAAAAGYAQMGLPREVVTLAGRTAAPFLPPENVLLQLMPRISNNVMRNIRIVAGQDLGAAPPFQARVLVYQYTLVPGADQAFTSFAVPPVLRGYRQVPMTGFSIAYSIPGQQYGNWGFWAIYAQTVEAPSAIFPKRIPTYAALFDSFPVNVRPYSKSLKFSSGCLSKCRKRIVGWRTHGG